MRGLQPQEKRGLKYLLQAANSGVGNPSARDCPQLGICRWRISGFLGNGSECQDFTAQCRGTERSLLERRLALGTDPTETALLGWRSSYSTSACIQLLGLCRFPIMEHLHPLQSKPFTTASLGELHCVYLKSVLQNWPIVSLLL